MSVNAMSQQNVLTYFGLGQSIFAYVQMPLRLFFSDEIHVMNGIRVISWGCLEGLTELTVDNGQEHHPT